MSALLDVLYDTPAAADSKITSHQPLCGWDDEVKFIHSFGIQHFMHTRGYVRPTTSLTRSMAMAELDIPKL